MRGSKKGSGIIRVRVIPIIVGAIGMASPPGFWKGIWDQRKDQNCTTAALWRSAKYSEESWRPEETCCRQDSCEKPPANARMKKSQIIIIMMMIIIIITRKKKW